MPGYDELGNDEEKRLTNIPKEIARMFMNPGRETEDYAAAMLLLSRRSSGESSESLP